MRRLLATSPAEPPAVAQRASELFATKLMVALRKFEEEGVKIEPTALTKAAGVNRTTLWSKRKDNSFVHQDLLDKIEEARRRQLEAKSRTRTRRPLDEIMTELASLRAEQVRFANTLHQLRFEREQAELLALQAVRKAQIERLVAYELALVVQALIGTASPIVASTIREVEDDPKLAHELGARRSNARRILKEKRGANGVDIGRGGVGI